MFAPRNIIAYRVADLPPLKTIEAALAENVFTGRGSQEWSRSGWVAPERRAIDSLAVDCHGSYLVALKEEAALLPAGVVAEQVAEKVEIIESEQSRKMYRKERLQIKDEVLLDLLPRAFARAKVTRALLCPTLGWLFVEASSHATAESLLNQLREALGSLKVALPNPKNPVEKLLTRWVEGEAMPEGWTLGDEALLCDSMVSASQINAKGQDLQSDEICAHLVGGMLVKRLALQWHDQLRLMVHEDLSLHRLRLCDEYREQLDAEAAEDALADLQTSAWRYAQELSRLMSELTTALGGLHEDLVSAEYALCPKP